MNMLYCIKHEKMVKAEESGGTGLIHFDVADYPDNLFDLEVCEFPLGWATFPPPAFDMEEFMQTVVEPLGYDARTLDERYYEAVT